MGVDMNGGMGSPPDLGDTPPFGENEGDWARTNTVPTSDADASHPVVVDEEWVRGLIDMETIVAEAE